MNKTIPKKNMVLWKDINWKLIQRKVFRLQTRIYKASYRKDYAAMRNLQKILISSWYAKLLAVRKVTQDNQGKKTAGIDGIKLLTPKQRFELANELKLEGKCSYCNTYFTSEDLLEIDHILPKSKGGKDTYDDF